MTSRSPSTSQKSTKPEAELPFHPACAEFDVMEGEEFNELVADIQRRGLRYPIITHKGTIIDGRNRALACAKAGVTPRYQEFDGSDEDVVRFIISSNVHRRHLTAEQRREKLVKLLKLHPEQSDRVLAAETGFSHTTVQKARKKATGNRLPVGKRVGKDGKARRMPTKKPQTNGATASANNGAGELVTVRSSTETIPLVTPEAVASINQQIEAKADTALSAGERQALVQGPQLKHFDRIARDFENTIHWLETKKLELESEIKNLEERVEALKAKLDTPADVKITVQAAIEALIFEVKHTVYFENSLPENAVYRSVDLQEVATRLRHLDKSMAKRRKAAAAQRREAA
jgi:hypothetical protein